MTSPAPVTLERFRHEALLYAGADDFADRASAFLRQGMEAGDAMLVVVSPQKIEALQRRLGSAAREVQFADMAAVGANPARIIPAWQRFVDNHTGEGRGLRGIGEPIYPERSETELVECVRHEALLNVAFEDGPAWWLLCPYDVTTLPLTVLDEAARTHPFVVHDRVHSHSELYRGGPDAAPWHAALPEPRRVEATLAFDAGTLAPLRRVIGREAARARFMSAQITNLVQAVNEVATNSVQHGGGSGTLRVWRNNGTIVCEVRDHGQFVDLLVDRRRPKPADRAGRGLWLANQLCDLVQLRSFPRGTVVRLHMRRDRSR